MGSIVQPYVPAVIASRIQEALACGLIGVILASWYVPAGLSIPFVDTLRY